LIIDAWFDNYVGVVMLVRVIDGEIKAKDKIHLMATKDEYACESVGIFTPKSIVGIHWVQVKSGLLLLE
jgi:GTP-binding protein LepA